MSAKPKNGQTRTCPYCGQKSSFYERLRLPRPTDTPMPAGEQEPAPKERAGWECENRKCTRRHDFS